MWWDFKTALTRAYNDYARKSKILKENESALTGEDIREGITAIVSVKLTDPQFEAPDKRQSWETAKYADLWIMPQRSAYHRIF